MVTVVNDTPSKLPVACRANQHKSWTGIAGKGVRVAARGLKLIRARVRALDPITPDVARRLDALLGPRLKQNGHGDDGSRRQVTQTGAGRSAPAAAQTAQSEVLAATAADEIPF